MKNYSSSNSWSTSSGDRVSSQYIQTQISKAKRNRLANMFNEQGYISCVECGVNKNGGDPIDCSHTVSVKECLESGRAELSWDVNNIQPRCRTCHRNHDQS